MSYQTAVYKSSQNLRAGDLVHIQSENIPMPQPPARFVETLRQRGIKVRVQHHRWSLPTTNPWEAPKLVRVSKYERKQLERLPIIFQNGGETHVSVQLPDGREAKGVAVCSTADQYHKKVGVYVATKRALASLKNENPRAFPPGSTAN